MSKKRARRRKKRGGKDMTTNNHIKNHTSRTIGFTVTECHKPTEVFRHLWLCKESQFADIAVSKKIDVAVPLISVSHTIWNGGWNGAVYAVPIRDYDILPLQIERKKVKEICEFIKEGFNVAMFCMGGHGRTGYLASLVLLELGIPNPIEYIRTKYCKNAVESHEQVKAIAHYAGDDSLLTTALPHKYSYFGDDRTAYSWAQDAWYKDKCKGCHHFLPEDGNTWRGLCTVNDDPVDANSWGSCVKFSPPTTKIAVTDSPIIRDSCATCGSFNNASGFCKANQEFMNETDYCGMYY